MRCGWARVARGNLPSFTVIAASRGLEAQCPASGGSSAGAHLALVAAMTAEDVPPPRRSPPSLPSWPSILHRG
jgi:acetyl esterase/lipase